ncbi:MAG: DUF2116 family Zn-ribbon domain-containing protein, partial [Promethearchaeota archaeon]
QKWKRRMRQEQEASVSIYPHYHCLVCDQMIEKGQSYKTVRRSSGKSVSYVTFCSNECYEKYAGKPKEKGKSKRWILYGLIPAVVIILVLLIIFVF